MSQSPALSKPYVVPSAAPGATQARHVHDSQKPPPALGMLSCRPGTKSKYSLSNKPSKGPKASRIPPFKSPTVNSTTNAPGSPSSSSGSRSNSGSGVAAHAMQEIASQVVPGPPHVAAIPASSRPPQVMEMSARRPEPVYAIDEGKEADSSYGDIPFDFDREALDEAMSAYDG